MSDPVRLGVIGCGNVLSAYAGTIARLRARRQAVVTVACGRESQREAAVQALNDCQFVLDERELLASAEVDAVLILTSMSEHARLVREALQAGKHVLVEKPLAASVEQARELISLAERLQRKLVCAPFTVLSPTFQTMAGIIRAGRIGKPSLARARYGWAGPWWSQWFYKPGGGCIFDLGVYCLTTLTGLLGPARRVTALVGISVPVREVQGRQVTVEAEDHAQLLIEFETGGVGVVTTGFTIQQYRSPALEIYGTGGTIQMLGDDWDPDGFELWENSAGCWQLFKETDPNWSWTAGLPHLIDCLHGNSNLIVRPEHALHVLEIMLKARAAAQSGCAEEITSRFEPVALESRQSKEAAHLIHDRTRGGGEA
jgi:predicted dehydrogenase